MYPIREVEEIYEDIIDGFLKHLLDDEYLFKYAVSLGEGIQQSDSPKPQKDAGWDAWFDYYHHCKKIGKKYTLVELSVDIGYSLQRVKEQHALYKASRDL